MKQILLPSLLILMITALIVTIVCCVVYMDKVSRDNKINLLNSLKSLTIPEKLDRIIIKLEKLE